MTMNPVEIKNDEEKDAANDQIECFHEIDISDYTRRTWFKAPDIKHLECPICKQIMRNPVKLNNVSAHTFCKQCIEIWLKIPKNRKTNPMTLEKIKGNVSLNDHEELRGEIKNLFFDCYGAKQKIQNYIVPQHGFGDYTKTKPETAKVAEKFYNENLKHLEGHFFMMKKMTEWATEQYQKIRNMSYPSNDEDSREQSLSQIDELKGRMHQMIDDRCDLAAAEIKNSDPNDAERHQQIRQALQEDMSCFKKILNAICWFFSEIWTAIKLTFKKIGQLVSWLFGWNSNHNDNNSNDMNQEIR